MNIIKKDQPAVAATSLHNTQDLFDQSDSSKSKVTVTNKQSLVVTKMTKSTNPGEKSLPDNINDIREKNNTSTTNDDSSTIKDTNSSTIALSSSRPMAACGGGKVIKIKRKKLPVGKEIVDASMTQSDKPVTPEPDAISEPQVDATQPAL